MPGRPQPLRARLFWFGAGAVLNYVLISTPFNWLETHTTLPIWAISACSVGVSTALLFVWNYFVNFRTDVRDRMVLVRYVAAVVLLWALSSSVLTALKHIDARLAFNVAGTAIDFDIVGTQCVLAGLKFLLYHKWVFPQGAAPGSGSARRLSSP